MTQNIWQLLLDIVLCLALLPVAVAQETRHVTAFGPGTKSCAEWTAADHGARGPMAFWILGYLTGIDAWGDLGDFLEKAAGQPSAALFRRIDEFCEINPKVRLIDASNVLACYAAGRREGQCALILSNAQIDKK
jgi:hypothetical protein